MPSRSLATLGPRACILIGCVLAMWPFVSASAQSVASNTRTALAPPTDSQLNIQTIRDRGDESKVSDSATDANGGTVTVLSKPPVESREFVQQYVAEKLTVSQQRLKLRNLQI